MKTIQNDFRKSDSQKTKKKIMKNSTIFPKYNNYLKKFKLFKKEKHAPFKKLFNIHPKIITYATQKNSTPTK